jgi:hypothetical protein
MKPEERELANKLRGEKYISKLAAKRLAMVWNSYHPDEEAEKSCFCSGIERKRFHAKFIAWMDESYPLNDDNSVGS